MVVKVAPLFKDCNHTYSIFPVPPVGKAIEVIKGGSKEVAQTVWLVPMLPALVMLLQVGVETVTVSEVVAVQPVLAVAVTV